MIDAIIQIPQRLPIGTILVGSEMMDVFDPVEQRHKKVLSGRSIRVVPLVFYKFFSQWGNSRYEHIFATDEPFDTIMLSRFIDGKSKTYSKNSVGSILVPISMKKIGQNSIETFLFAKSINFLLSNYQIGMSLSEIPFTGLQNIDINKTIEVPSIDGSLSCGVKSYGCFKKFIFEDVLYSTYGSTKLPPELDITTESITVEKPATIQSCIHDIFYNYSTKEEIWGYIDQLYQYETGEPIDPIEFFSEHSFLIDKGHIELSIDPLTAKCIMTPTFLTLNNLKPYLANNIVMRTYSVLGMYPQDDTFTKNIVPLQIGGEHETFAKCDMIESLLSIPDDWFSIYMTWDSYVPEYYSVFGHSSSIPSEMIHESCRQIFLNKWVYGETGAYDNIVVSKNWYDEVFISCKNKMGMTTYYISLAWFHLMSQSLVNKVLFLNK